jgi:hypothetical protein
LGKVDTNQGMVGRQIKELNQGMIGRQIKEL